MALDKWLIGVILKKEVKSLDISSDHVNGVLVSKLFPDSWPISIPSVSDAISLGKTNIQTAINYWKYLVDENDQYLPEKCCFDKPKQITENIRVWEKIRKQSVKSYVQSHLAAKALCRRCPLNVEAFAQLHNISCDCKNLILSGECGYSQCILRSGSTDIIDKLISYLENVNQQYLEDSAGIKKKINALESLRGYAKNDVLDLPFARPNLAYLKSDRVMFFYWPFDKFIEGEVLDTYMAKDNKELIAVVVVMFKEQITLGKSSKTHTIRTRDPRLVSKHEYILLIKSEETAKFYATHSGKSPYFKPDLFLQTVMRDQKNKDSILRGYYHVNGS